VEVQLHLFFTASLYVGGGQYQATEPPVLGKEADGWAPGQVRTKWRREISAGLAWT